MKQLEDISCGVASSNDDVLCIKGSTLCSFDTLHAAKLFDDIDDLAIKMNLPPAFDYALAHALDNMRKFVGSDVWARIHHNILRGAVLHKYGKHQLHISALIGACI